MNNTKMGVAYLVAHLVITLAILGVYAFSLVNGHPDETSKALLFSIVGYWFGAIGFDKIKQSNDSSKNSTPDSSDKPTGGEKQ